MSQILLVGNGSSILDNEIGYTIDQFPLVCRFNAFKTTGYEKYTGVKTNIWVTCLIDEVIKFEHKKYSKLYFPLCQKRFLDLVKIIPNAECFPPDIYIKATQINPGHSFYPSSGLMATLFFIGLNFDVTIHGFDFFQKRKHHYCDNEEVGPNHVPEMELLAFQTLIDEKKIKALI